MKERKELIGVVVSDKADRLLQLKLKLTRNIHYMEKELNIQRNMLLTMKIIWHMLEIKFA